MKLLLLLIALLVGEICLAEETTVPPREKNGTGPGRYGSERHHSDRGYGKRRHDDDDYGKHRRYRTPIVDDYICDLEATILVVSSKHHVKEEKPYGKTPAYGGNNNGQSYGAAPQQGYGNGGSSYGGGQQGYGSAPQQGYGNGGSSYGGGQQGYGGNNGPSYGESSYEKPKRHEYATPDALRLKCSHIAVHSEHDCHTCCQLSARRYHSYSKHEIFGFIIDASEIKEDGKGYERSKRDADYGSQSPPVAPNYQSQGYGQSAPVPASPNYPPPAYSAPSQSYPAPEASYPAPDYSVPSYSAPTPEYQEQPQAYSADSEYPSNAPASYSGKSHRSYGPPKDARCVCCSPKRHDYHHERRDYDRSYDRSDSNEY